MRPTGANKKPSPSESVRDCEKRLGAGDCSAGWRGSDGPPHSNRVRLSGCTRLRRQSPASHARSPPLPARLESCLQPSAGKVQKRALVMLVMNRDIGDPNRDIGDPGARDFKFGVTGVLLMVAVAVILMIAS
jgi:hypothetical protein